MHSFTTVNKEYINFSMAELCNSVAQLRSAKTIIITVLR